MLNLYLPGFSAGNEEFLAKYTKKLRKLGYHVYGRRWDHWADEGEAYFDTKKEAAKLWPVLKQFREQVGVVAKSIGTLVTAELINTQKFTPKYLILMGIPLQKEQEQEIAEFIAAFKSVSCPITVFQNAGDPTAKRATVEVLAKAIGAKLEIQPRDDHKYEYLTELLSLIKPYNDANGEKVA